MSDDHEMQQRCRLLELPSEVRLIIYGMAFPSRRTSLYAAAELFRSGQKNTHRSVALLATCRAIYTEAQPVLYENTEFKIWCTSAEDSGHLKNILSARPLIGQMRKLLVQITLADSEPLVDPDNERKWYQTLTSELILLDEAPHLKNIHIELDAWYGGTHVVAAFDHAMSQLSTLKYRFAPTVSIDSTLRDTDLEPSSYHDMLTRLGWVDTTQDVIATKLTDLSSKRSRTRRKIQDKSKWTATKIAQYRDIVNNDNFFAQGSDLRRQARSMSFEIEQGFRDIDSWDGTLANLERAITTEEEYLTWVSEKRLARAGAKLAAGDGSQAIVGCSEIAYRDGSEKRRYT